LIDLLADLTQSQREAVTHVEGPLLVLAGAGSGKTRVITRRIANMLRQGIPGDSILALTFTNKAAGEMRERVESLASRSGVWLGTFHSLCARLLRNYASLVGIDRGFTIYDQADRVRVVKQVMSALQLEELAVTPERVDAAISKAKNDLLDPVAFARRGGDHVASVAAAVYPEYQKRLRESAAVDFDDLLVHMVSILKHHADVRASLDRRFRYVLVDEYQDTNLAQYAIVRALSADHPNLCVTGDPDQSIYGWRGANLGNILEFERDYPGCKVVKLERNYRSTKNILKVADHLIRHNHVRKSKSLTTENPAGVPVELSIYGNEAEEAQSVVSKIIEKARDGDYRLGEIAVFVRLTALTRNFETLLRSAKIPYQVVGGMSFYERSEVKDVLAYLSLMNNPKDDVAFLRVANVPPRGLGETSLAKLTDQARALGIPLLEMAGRASEAPGLKDRAIQAFREFHRLVSGLTSLRDHSAEEVVSRVLSLTGYQAFLAAEGKGAGEERQANVDELVSAAREFDREHPGSSITEFMEQISLSSAVDRWQDEEGAVTLMTLHAAKGLEFPLVFIVGLEQGLLPHSRAFESESETEEERRLFFVGITRAQRELHFSRCMVREFRGKTQPTVPSRFLSELPHEEMTIRNHSGSSTTLGYAGPRRSDSRPSYSSPPSRGFQITTAAALGNPSAIGPPDDLSRFAPGVTVVHPKYGLGRIVEIEGAGPRRKGRIKFAVGGERTFELAQTPLRVVSGASR
jgi:DNA helicase-2/ATP-dependent DNA helicase PcrA